jgi:hypothetical protein
LEKMRGEHWRRWGGGGINEGEGGQLKKGGYKCRRRGQLEETWGGRHLER